MTSPTPRTLTNVAQALATEPTSGVRWKLDAPDRGLDANIVTLEPGRRIDRHRGAEVDVLLQVVDGSGTLLVDGDPIDLAPGDLVWLPRHSMREFVAGPVGLTYLTVHPHRESLVLAPFAG